MPQGTAIKPGQRHRPAGPFRRPHERATSRQQGGPAKLEDLEPLHRPPAADGHQQHGELKLDYGKGVLTINAPAAQGVSGALRRGRRGRPEGPRRSPPTWKLGHIVAVSLDDQPLADLAARSCCR